MQCFISNPKDGETEAFEARAAVNGAVVALVGMFVLLGLLSVWLALNRPGSGDWKGAGICAGMAVLLVVSLRGIRVRITEGVLEYRNVLYLTQRCLLSDIEQCAVRWMTVRRAGALFSQQQLTLEARLSRTNAIFIPLEHFRPTDQARMRELLGAEDE